MEPVAVTYLRWIPLLPLLGAAINGLGGAILQKRAGRGAISVVACTPVVLAFLLSLRAFFELVGLDPERRMLLDQVWTWIDIGQLHADVAFVADPLSAIMILVITGVGGLIHLYSTGYMHEEPASWRYFAYLNLFTFAMLVLVLGDNLLLMFVGWEGVGLCSYALIGFWYSEWKNASAGSKAFIVNRVGDFGFTLGLFLLFWSMADVGHPTVTFRELAHHAHLLEGHLFLGASVVTVITMLMFVGATGKSAQIPLYVWLPDAMAGPTPVSALIHAATMVTAGVYMIARTSFLFSMAPATLHVIATIGALTALFAATIGATQHDIKKVLAYSTVSQLGYMFLAMGVGAYAAGIFHLMTHAFFKACLFLGAGSVIHAMHHEQDMRKMGGLKKWMPWTYGTFLVSTLAIAGIPPFAGFFSKDEILWRAFSSQHGSPLLWLIGVSAAGLSAFYMFRQVFLTFEGECRVDHHTREHLHESPRIMVAPLVILAGLAILSGFLGVPHALGGANRIELWLEPVFRAGGAHAAAPHHAEVVPLSEYVVTIVSVVVAGLGIFVARAMYLTKTLSPDRITDLAGGRIYRVVFNKYYVDELYEAVIINGTLALSKVAAAFDQYVIDFLVNATATATRAVSWLNGAFDAYFIDGIVNFIADATLRFGQGLRRLQTGSINGYLYVVAFSVVLVMVIRLM